MGDGDSARVEWCSTSPETASPHGNTLHPTSTPATFYRMATAAVVDMDGPPAGDMPADIVDVGLLRSYLASLLTPGQWKLPVDDVADLSCVGQG
jgi:hypothetical protein